MPSRSSDETRLPVKGEVLEIDFGDSPAPVVVRGHLSTDEAHRCIEAHYGQSDVFDFVCDPTGWRDTWGEAVHAWARWGWVNFEGRQHWLHLYGAKRRGRFPVTLIMPDGSDPSSWYNEEPGEGRPLIEILT
jgi:hypothetical protein